MSVELSVRQSRPLPTFTPPALQDWQYQPCQHSRVIFVLLTLFGVSAHLFLRPILRVLYFISLFLLVAQTLPLLCSFHNFTFQVCHCQLCLLHELTSLRSRHRGYLNQDLG